MRYFTSTQNRTPFATATARERNEDVRPARLNGYSQPGEERPTTFAARESSAQDSRRPGTQLVVAGVPTGRTVPGK